MPDIVKLLPDSVANQIAAGEVIQRPASVVKELMENAIDAGATSIKVNIKEAGRTLIQIVDNGCGMSPGDASMAFERHATSKITKISYFAFKISHDSLSLLQLRLNSYSGTVTTQIVSVVPGFPFELPVTTTTSPAFK